MGSSGAVSDDDEIAERALVERILAGDQRAYETLVVRYQPSIRAIFSVLQDTILAETLIQQTFINAYQHLGRLRRDGRFGPWTRGIAQNLLREELRRGGRESKWLRAYHQYLLDRGEHDVQAEEERRRRAEAVAECIDELPTHAATAIRMRYDEGTNLEQIAAALDRSALATRQLLFRTLHQYHHASTMFPTLRRVFTNINNVYVELFANLVGKLDAIEDGGGKTLLDNAVAILGSEYGGNSVNGNAHDGRDLPILLAGSGSGFFKTGQILDNGGRGHTQLLGSLLEYFGLDDGTGSPSSAFGNRSLGYSFARLPGLKAP